jgi:hypothetical protein
MASGFGRRRLNRVVEGRGWLQNSYSRIYLKFDAEMVPSGLLGPVRLVHLGTAPPAAAAK